MQPSKGSTSPHSSNTALPNDNNATGSYVNDYGNYPSVARSLALGGQGPTNGEFLQLVRRARSGNPPDPRPELIAGLLRQAQVGLISAVGKLGKSYILLYLAFCVILGREWLGFECRNDDGLDVLFVNPEIDETSFERRISDVASTMQAPTDLIDQHFYYVTTRSTCLTIDRLVGELSRYCGANRFALIIIDSASVFVSGDENSSIAVRNFFTHVNVLAVNTNAAVFMAHHHGKGASGDRAAHERARGSSVWFDAPDLVLTLSELFPRDCETGESLGVGERAALLETAGVRGFRRPADSIHLILRHPVPEVDTEGITMDWQLHHRRLASRNGRKGGMASAETRSQKASIRQSDDARKVVQYLLENSPSDAGQGVPISRIAKDVFGDDRVERAKRAVTGPNSDIFELDKPAKNRLNVRLKRDWMDKL